MKKLILILAISLSLFANGNEAPRILKQTRYDVGLLDYLKIKYWCIDGFVYIEKVNEGDKSGLANYLEKSMNGYTQPVECKDFRL